jgi:tetratricopeptide (TPR) repeat protein
MLGTVAKVCGDLASSRRLLGEAVALDRAHADSPQLRETLHAAGETERDSGNQGRARMLLEESLALSRDLHDDDFAAATMHSLGDLFFDGGDVEAAAQLYRDGARLFGCAENVRGLTNCLGGLAAVAARAGDEERAAALFEVVRSFEHRLGAPLLGPDERRRYVAVLGEERMVSGARIRAPSLADAVALALAG